MGMGKLIRRRRLEQGYGQRELAEIIGTSPSWVSDIELGKKVNLPPVEAFHRLVDTLRLSDAELLRAFGYLRDSEPRDDGDVLRRIEAMIRNDIEAEVIRDLMLGTARASQRLYEEQHGGAPIPLPDRDAPGGALRRA